MSATSPAYAIEARGIRKVFGKNVALDNLELRVAEGRIVGTDGKLYAHGTTTCIVIEDKSGRSEKPVG